MSVPGVWPQVLSFFGTPLVIENRNKEIECDLAMDRLSDHRFVANSFRLYLHAAAMHLLVRLRRFIAEPLPALAPQAEPAPPTCQPGEAALRADEACVPVEALTGGGAAAPLPPTAAA